MKAHTAFQAQILGLLYDRPKPRTTGASGIFPRVPPCRKIQGHIERLAGVLQTRQTHRSGCDPVWYHRATLDSDETYTRRCSLIESRLDALLSEAFTNAEAVRIAKRLRKYRDALFTFLYHADVPFDNNHAERSIRPSVLIRRTSHGNQSLAGADTQSILMSLFRALRGLPPTATLCAALREFILTGKLPTMEGFTANR